MSHVFSSGTEVDFSIRELIHFTHAQDTPPADSRPACEGLYWSSDFCTSRLPSDLFVSQ